MRLGPAPAQRTLRVETRSAVSRRVSWLIWSTMVSILGFDAAASVELNRRDVVEARSMWAETRAEEDDEEARS